MIPYLTRIDNELAHCADPEKQAELHAEKAAYLARTGDFAGANEILAALRRVYGDGRSLRVSIWIMLVEGLILYFEKLSSAARDRIRRGYALAAAMQISDLRGLLGAWLVHLEIERSAYEVAIPLAAEVLSGMPSVDATSRVSMVLGDMFLYVGLRPQSQIWYEHSRRTAVDRGDRAAIGALMYNRAAFGLARIRLERFSLSREVDGRFLELVEGELSSSRSFQHGTDVKALTHLVDICDARLAVLKGSFVRALDLLLPLRATLSEAEDRSNRSAVDADLLFSLLSLGKLSEARQLLGEMQARSPDSLDPDDRYVDASIARDVGVHLGLDGEIGRLQSEWETARGLYDAEISRVCALLEANHLQEIPRWRRD